MKTVVIPTVENQTGDTSQKENYRSISLAMILAKVPAYVLGQCLIEKLNLHGSQFVFKNGLSTESTGLILKNTVRYYTDRNTSQTAFIFLRHLICLGVMS